MPKYALAFEEHLDPIKKRGKVVLDGAIPEGASIQVIRKTPIETEFLAQALKPLPTEALEHALDKICYIQQEIEGHLCDCRGEEYPGIPGEGAPPGGSDAPECQPYSCNAYDTELLLRTMSINELHRHDPLGWAWFGPAYKFEANKWHFWTEYINAPGASTDWGNSIAAQTDMRTFSWYATENFDICEGTVDYCVSSHGGSPTGALTWVDSYGEANNQGGCWGDFLFSTVMCGYNGTGDIDGNLVWNTGKVWAYAGRQRPGTGSGTRVYNPAWRISITKNGPGDYDLVIRKDLGDNGGLVYETHPLGDISTGWHLFTVKYSSTTPVQIPHPDPWPGAPDQRGYTNTIRLEINFDDLFIETSGVHIGPEFAYEGAANDIYERKSNLLYEGPVFFRDNKMSFAYLDIKVENDLSQEASIDTIYTAWARNHEDYTPPAHCQFSGAEI